MKKTVKTDNKLYQKLFAILFTCSLIFAGIPTLTIADTYPKEVLKIDFSSAQDYTLNENTTATVENGALKLSSAGDAVSLKPFLKVNTNYTFSFKMKNSVADALSMKKASNFFYYKNGTASMESVVGSAYNYLLGGGTFSYIVQKDLTFGVERTGEAANEWRDVSINFTTPWQSPGVTHSYVNLSLECVVANDENLYVDDLIVTETGNVANRVFNGDFEALDKSKDKILPTSFEPAASKFDEAYYEIVEENGNHYLQCTTSGSNYPGVISSQAFLAKKDYTNLGGKADYKFSLKYKQTEIKNNSNGPRFRFNGTAKNGGLEYIRTTQLPELDNTLKDTWVTYSVYLDGDAWIGENKTTSKSSDVYFGYQARNYCMDDLYLGFDESNIDFHRRLDFYYYTDADAKLNRYFYDSAQTTPPAYSLMSERSIPASSLEDLKTDGDCKLVTPRVHYVPTQNATGGYDVHNITLVAAVYGTDANGNRILHSVKLASDKTTADGKTIDVKIDNVEVPAEGNYQVETMAINMDNMKPLVNKTILTNSGVVVEE